MTHHIFTMTEIILINTGTWKHFLRYMYQKILPAMFMNITMAFNTAQNTLSTFWTYKHLQHVKGGHITVINLRRKIYDVILTMQSTSCECQLDVPTTVRRLNYMS